MLQISRARRKLLLIAVYVLSSIQPAHASDIEAIQISVNIQQFHMPFGTIMDPVFASSDPASPDYSLIVGYTRAGDSAVWTGHYLAAEAFRYQVTRSPEALNNAWRAVWGIRSLIDVTGTGVLARCLVPADSIYGPAIQKEEGGHGIYYNRLGDQTYFWIGNTSRDQYSGVLFGLSAAYEMIDDPAMRSFIRTDVTKIVNYLLTHNWNVQMPDGQISTTFMHRPDQQLSFLQVARRINPQAFDWTYMWYRALNAASAILPVSLDDIDDHNHYFKFNINYINLYDLVRLEENGLARQLYVAAYNELRRTTEWHGNAHFNMLDRVLKGANDARDSETRRLLELWQQRPTRDGWIDLRGLYASCGDDRACVPISIIDRVNTDFLWQRSPFLLAGGGVGTIETSGIDYILPFWMARQYGVVQ
jgi:hypothetical protein